MLPFTDIAKVVPLTVTLVTAWLIHTGAIVQTRILAIDVALIDIILTFIAIPMFIAQTLCLSVR